MQGQVVAHRHLLNNGPAHFFAGKKGTAVVLFTDREVRALGVILQQTKVENAELVSSWDVTHPCLQVLLVPPDTVPGVVFCPRHKKKRFLFRQVCLSMGSKQSWCDFIEAIAISFIVSSHNLPFTFCHCRWALLSQVRCCNAQPAPYWAS